MNDSEIESNQYNCFIHLKMLNFFFLLLFFGLENKISIYFLLLLLIVWNLICIFTETKGWEETNKRSEKYCNQLNKYIYIYILIL